MKLTRPTQFLSSERFAFLGLQRSPKEAREAVRSSLMPAFETLLGILIICAASVVLPGQHWGLLTLQPYPLWIVVLAIAVRYGGRNGYLAGGLCGIAYGLLLWTSPDNRFQPLTAHALIQPFLMFAVGAILGELCSARERRVADLETSLAGVRNDLGTLWERCQTIEKLKGELERQIAFQPDSIVALTDLGKRLQSLNVYDLHKTIVDISASFLRVDACSLYLYQGECLSLEAGVPEIWSARPMAINVYDPLVGRAIRDRRVVSVRDLVRVKDKSAPDTQALMAGPLILSDGRIYGVVVIESGPFGSITPSSILRFDKILNWAAVALENAILFEQAQSGLGIGEQLQQAVEISWMLTPGVRSR
jgi:hypothetical protein